MFSDLRNHRIPELRQEHSQRIVIAFAVICIISTEKERPVRIRIQAVHGGEAHGAYTNRRLEMVTDQKRCCTIRAMFKVEAGDFDDHLTHQIRSSRKLDRGVK